MNPTKAIADLVEYLQEFINISKLEPLRHSLVVRVDYESDSSEKNFIKICYGSQILKGYNPGLLFLTKKQDYFKNSREMCIFFIKSVFNKQINLDTNKKFSKYKINFSQLHDVKIKTVNNLLENVLIDKKTSPRSNLKI